MSTVNAYLTEEALESKRNTAALPKISIGGLHSYFDRVSGRQRIDLAETCAVLASSFS